MLLTELQLGDILLLEDTEEWKKGHKMSKTKHLGIRAGQKYTGLNVSRSNKGRAKLIHAVICVREESAGGVKVGEASGQGHVQISDLRDGTYEVYTCTSRLLADRASQAARTWAGTGTLGYAKGKAVGSVFHSDTLGEKGEQRALMYAYQIDQERPSWGGSGAFCSEFVVACYQAAAIELDRVKNSGAATWDPLQALKGDVLQCDAKHCSVRALHDRLFRDPGFSHSLTSLDV